MGEATGSSPPPAVTLRDVAARAGVSTATASKALNGLPVAPVNRGRVLAAAEALGYVANAAARTMRRGHTGTIGLVLRVDMDPRTDLMAILHSQVGELQAHGYSVLISLVARDEDGDPLLRRLLERRVDALVHWNARGGPALEAFRRACIPVLAVGDRDAAAGDVPMVAAETAPAFDALYARVAALGHAAVVEVDPCHSAELHGDAARRHGVRVVQRRVGADPDAVRRFLAALLADGDAPTVVMAAHPAAVAVSRACEDAGARVPEDLSVVATTDADTAPSLRTPLSALRADNERLGHAVAVAVLAALDGQEVGDVVVPGCVTWVERASLGPAPTRSSSTGRTRRA